MNIILKIVLVTKSAVFLKSLIQDISLKYLIKAMLFLLHLKQEYFQNSHLS